MAFDINSLCGYRLPRALIQHTVPLATFRLPNITYHKVPATSCTGAAAGDGTFQYCDQAARQDLLYVGFMN